MKKFIAEFKTFIARGNVMDLAVGVIIGSAFTAIVTALTKNILQPFINFLIYLVAGGNGKLDGVYTILVGSADDLANAIYIDWGAFISAIINFLLIAWVLFILVKLFNRLNKDGDRLMKNLSSTILTKAEKKEMKEMGLNYKSLVEIKKFKAEKLAEFLENKKELEKQEKEKQEEERKHTTEYLLEEIKHILEKK